MWHDVGTDIPGKSANITGGGTVTPAQGDGLPGPLVAVLAGSASDAPVVAKVTTTLDQLAIPYEVTVASAHRTPDTVAQFARTAHERGIAVIIALAGGSAHLAGVIAAYTHLPVIGVPVKAWATDGLDALLATVQMPSGVPVATVAIDGGANAAFLAARILALRYPELVPRLAAHREQMAAQVAAAGDELRRRLAGAGSPQETAGSGEGP